MFIPSLFFMNLPKLGEHLTPEQVKFLEAFRKSCAYSIIAMLKNSQSGHPGGSLSCLDYLALLYCYLVAQSGDPVIVSNGHISPGVYSVLAELGYVDKAEVIENFRKPGSIFEGHVTRHVPGVWYGTGPLGVGISAASGFAIADQLSGKSDGRKIYTLVGDGEAQEGQVYEMMNFANKYKLDNLIAFMDYNEVQLTDSLEEILPMDFRGHFEAAGWHVIDVNGHDYEEMWSALAEAHSIEGKPVMLIGHTIMGKGVEFMEPAGRDFKPDWHGKAPSPEDCDEILKGLESTAEERFMIDEFVATGVTWKPEQPVFAENLSKIEGFDMGEAIVYEAGKPIDCRTGYGKALEDLATRNENVVAVCADLRGSVMTKFVAEKYPERHIEVGVAEQQMVSVSGGMSLDGYVPFCSTFGAFMSSRAKDQARVNDINHANVKMVATHCGLSVGEDGPTHQAIDDMGSFLGFFGTMVIEPADANQCDRIIRYVGGHYGNFYVRMGRHKFEPITNENGELFYGADYEYEYGKCDVIREGGDVTIAASGALVSEAVKACEALKEAGVSAEVVAVSSIKKFDENLMSSIRKTGKVVTVEDHNTRSGLGGMLAREVVANGISVEKFEMMGVEEYQLSGTWKDLYGAVGLLSGDIVEKVKGL